MLKIKCPQCRSDGSLIFRFKEERVVDYFEEDDCTPKINKIWAFEFGDKFSFIEAYCKNCNWSIDNKLELDKLSQELITSIHK